MRHILILTIFACLALAPFSAGAPKGATWADRLPVKAGEGWKTIKTFRGGERACVLAIGDHKSESPNLHIKVYDKNGNLVAEDKGTGSLVSDYVAVFWYPPRDGEYRIEVNNLGATDNVCYIAIK